MIASVRLVFAFVIALALQPPARAQAPDPAVGVYVADIMETATGIEILADGRFLWGFSQGALDLVAEGRWVRDGDEALILTSDPPVVAPSFELVASDRDSRPGLLVRLDAESAEAWPYLHVEAEHADGSRSLDPFGGAEHRFPEGPPVVAVRLGSGPFDFESDRFPVDVGRANVLTFRLVANGLGRVDFRGQRAAIEPEALSFEWRGMNLRYVRMDQAGAGGSESCPVAGERPKSLDIGLAEPLADTIARSTYDLEAGRTEFDLPARSGCETVNLTIRFRGQRLDAGPVGGSDLLSWSLEPSARGQVELINFAYQDRLLTLGEALDRARSLRPWFDGAGFVEHPAAAAVADGDYRPFQLIDGMSTGERAADWESARQRLADEADGASTMHLYTMRSGDHYGRVIVENLRRATTDGSGQAYVRTDGEHEWRVSVSLMLDPAQLIDMNFGQAAPTGDVAPLRAGPILPRDVAPGAPSVGVYDIRLGEPFEATAARSTFPFRPEAGLGNDFADGVAEVRIRWGDNVYDAGRVTNLSWYVNDRGGVPYVKAIGFSHEDGLLDLHEALVRARALQAWLVQAGFTPGGPPDADERPAFSLIHPYRYDEQVAGWEEAEALLADAESGVQGLDLYRMRAGGWYATVTVINNSRLVDGPPASDPARQWDLQVGFDSELDLVPSPGDDE